jgi:hypothetical protein
LGMDVGKVNSERFFLESGSSLGPSPSVVSGSYTEGAQKDICYLDVLADFGEPGVSS